MHVISNDSGHPLAERFRAFIKDPEFPCVGAKSALAKGQMTIVVARDIASAWDDMRIWPAIDALAKGYARAPKLFQSLAILFADSASLDEHAFEEHLWARIQSLTNKDAWLGQRPDARVSDDPDNPHFSLSFGGEAFFVVGLHPNASRPARRFEVPVMVFNLHDQFEQLRTEGRYEKMRATIMGRDVALAGSENPMLARHGSISEARQYSGRAVNSDWACPLPDGRRRRMRHEIAPRTGTAFALEKGQRLTVIDPRGEQVADLLAFNRADVNEVISSGRTLDYAGRIYLTTGDKLYSNRSNVLLEIVEDDVGRHDFLLTPCSKDTFRIIYGDTDPHQGCFGNLAAALAPYGVTEDMIPIAFNCFMNVPVDGITGQLRVDPPLSKAGDRIVFEAKADLVIGLTACSALQSNNGSFKPIAYEIA